MSNRKITDMVALTTPASDDVLPIVDISEAAAVDKNKKISIEELFKGVPDGTAAAPSIAFESDGDNGIFLAGTNAVGIATAGTQRVTVDSSGNVGIGTSSGSNVLNIHQTDAASNSYLHITHVDGGDGSSNGLSIGLESDGVNAVIRNRENGYLRMYTNNTERLRITSGGNIGIARSAPDNQLSIGSTASFETDANSFYLGSNFTGTGQNFIGSSKHAQRLFFNNASSNGYLSYANTGSAGTAGNAITWQERLRILSNGNIGIGEANPASLLHLTSQSSPALRLQDSTNNCTLLMYAQNSNTHVGTSSDHDLIFDTNSTERLRIDSSGNVGLGTSSFTATSSGRQILELNGASSSLINLDVGGARQAFHSADGTDAYSYNTANGSYIFGTNDTERMRIDSSGNVVLGYAGASLYFKNSFNNSSSRISNAGGSNSSNFRFLVNNSGSESEAMRIDSSGTLLIGASSQAYSSSRLEVADTDNAIQYIYNTDVSASGTVTLAFGPSNSITGSQIKCIATEDFSSSANRTADLAFETRKDGTLAERLRIDSSGFVGIGGTPNGSAGYGSLSLNGSGSTQSGYLAFIDSSGNLDARIFVDNSVMNIQADPASATSGSAIAFRTDSSEAMRLDSSGRLLVGTTSGQGNSLLQVQGDAASTAAEGIISLRRGLNTATIGGNVGSDIGRITFGANDGTVAATIRSQSDAAWSSTSDCPGRLMFSTTADGASSPTERMRILSSGAMLVPYIYATTSASAANVIVGSDGNLFRSTSSAKYKTQVEDLQDSYADALLNCRPVWYRSTCELDDATYGYWGFIAEEVAEIDPRLIHWKKTEITYDEEGKTIETACEPEAEGVQYDRFVPHLLNLIKRQQTAIEILETKVAALEAG